jgi:DNA replication protein DnaC
MPEKLTQRVDIPALTNEITKELKMEQSPLKATVNLTEKTENCPIHGDYQSRNFLGKIWSKCGACRAESAEIEISEEKAKRHKARIDRMVLDSGLDGRFKAATFANYTACLPEQIKVVKACQDYVQNFKEDAGGGLWLVGPPGTGKTHLGSAMVSAMIHTRQTPSMIFSSREIIRKLRATWGQQRGSCGSSEQDVIDELAQVPMLVIDEIGVSFGSDSEHVQLFDVLDLRYKHARPTVLLSNLPTKELKQGLGDRAYDRLREGSTAISCKWPSHRGNKDIAAMMQWKDCTDEPKSYT